MLKETQTFLSLNGNPSAYAYRDDLTGIIIPVR
jgi:hypothetical protein